MSVQDTSDSTRAAVSSRIDRADDAAERESRRQSEERHYTHLLTVLSVSSGMVGVCLTAIGLIGIMKSLTRLEMIVDDVLAVSTLLFTIAAMLAFFGLRTRIGSSWRRLAIVLDAIFCLGLAMVVVATMLLTWVLI